MRSVLFTHIKPIWQLSWEGSGKFCSMQSFGEPGHHRIHLPSHRWETQSLLYSVRRLREKNEWVL